MLDFLSSSFGLSTSSLAGTCLVVSFWGLCVAPVVLVGKGEQGEGNTFYMCLFICLLWATCGVGLKRDSFGIMCCCCSFVFVLSSFILYPYGTIYS